MMQSDIQRSFYTTVKDTLPYLIFSPPDFRNKLAEQVDGLFHFFNGGDSSIASFNQCNDNIQAMIKDACASFDWNTNINIEKFNSMYKSFDERISELYQMVLSLQKDRKIPRTKKEPEPIIISEPTISSIEPIIVSTKPTVSSTEPIIASIAKCPSCGKSLQHKSLKGSEGFYCFESKGGCGKRYVGGMSGVLIERTATLKPLYICQCGTELHAQGKKEIDGYPYQIYACESSTKGGCGTGYIQDKSGGLHVGRSKRALNRPTTIPKPE
jgi:hypothetical protein